MELITPTKKDVKDTSAFMHMYYSIRPYKNKLL